MDQVDLVPTAGRAWLRDAVTASPQAHARLLANPTARVLLVSSGGSRAALSLAEAYPGLRVDGIDPDDGAVAAARREAALAGVDDRVRFDVSDPTDLTSAGSYDLVVVCGSDEDGHSVTVVLDPGRASG